MITDEKAYQITQWLVDIAETAAAAKAQATFLTEEVKAVAAELQRKSEAKTHAQREAYALTHPAHRAAREAARDAQKEDWKYRILIKGAEAELDFWRTHSANHRGAMHRNGG